VGLVVHRLYGSATVEIKPREILVVKDGKGLTYHRYGRVLAVPFLQRSWLISLEPFTIEGTLQDLQNLEGTIYTARLQMILRIEDSPDSLQKTADRFFGLPRDRINATLLDIAQRNFFIFLQEYDTDEREILFKRVEESVRDDAQILGISVDNFSVLDFYDREKRLQEKLEMTFGGDKRA